MIAASDHDGARRGRGGPMIMRHVQPVDGHERLRRVEGASPDVRVQAVRAARVLRVYGGGGDTMHILAMFIVGLIVGALAKLFMPGKDPGGIIVTTLLGIAGSFVAGFIGRAVGWYRDPASGPGIIASILGAMLLLLVYRLIIAPTQSRRRCRRSAQCDEAGSRRRSSAPARR